jgi:glycosyltransferase involved in cell wall biosynthesis
MRLLYLNHNFRHYGTYFRAMPIAEHMVKRGHKVTLLTVSPTLRTRASWSVVNGVRLGEMPNFGQMNSGGGYGPLDNLYRIAHATAHRYDLIHMFDHKPNATFAGFPGRLRGAKLVSDWADWWGGPGGLNDVPRRIPAVGKFEEWWEVACRRWADAVTATSTILQQRAIEHGCSPDRVIYIPTGAATERIKRIPVAEARQKLNIPIDRRMVGYIGNLARPELEKIMSAMQQLNDVWLMAVGPASAEVYELAQSFGVADRLWQTGLVVGDAVTTYLGCADVLCIPMTDTAKDRGRQPVKLMDYMAAGRPIIAGPVGDVKTIVEKYAIGLFANDRASFLETLQHLFANADLRESMGQTARHIAETQFNWNTLAEQLETFYTRVLAG